jgi:hypothetical protein
MRHFAVVLAVLLTTIATPLHATTRCQGTTLQTLSVQSGVPFDLPVSRRSGANHYFVQSAFFFQQLPNETWLILGNSTYELVSQRDTLKFTETAFATWPGNESNSVYYVVTALNTFEPSFVPCAQDVLVTVTSDARLQKDSTRFIVPVAGSVKGAFNSSFRTRLILENRWQGESDVLTGRIVFHRTGTTASSNDPSINYSIAPEGSVIYDDVMDALHATGVGTLDILPDPGSSGFYASPGIRAQIVSIASDGGVFSAELPAVSMTGPYYGSVWAGTFAPRILITDTTQKRYALGVRTLSDEVTLTVRLADAAGVERAAKTRVFPAEYHEQIPIADWFSVPIAAGDTLTFDARHNAHPDLPGGAVVYLAETDNKTNDVSIVVPYRDPFSTIPPIVTCSIGCSFLSF